MEKIILPDTEMTIKRPLIVVDYAHTPDALEKGLGALKAHAKGKLICLFGCGGDRDKGKRPLMAKIAQQHADQVVVTSDNPRTESAEQIIEEIIGGFNNSDSGFIKNGFIKTGFKQTDSQTISSQDTDFQNKVVIEVDREKAIHATLQTMSPDDVLLIAGKGHEDYQEINGERFPFSDKGSVLAFYSSDKEQESSK
jgi:UDP-N-acetylmuramoyl-L-alanyl-D-glutamate--2,6-diaminopimelate ligase